MDTCVLWMEWCALTVGVVYAAVAAGYVHGGQTGLGLAYLGYALANVGLVWAGVSGR